METDRAGRFWIRFTCYAVGALALLMGGLVVLDTLVDFRPGAGQFVCAGVGVVLLGSGLLLIVRGPSAVLSKEGEAALADELEKRVDREGQPTEPEAYQDGGLAVAATAYSVEEAHVIASVLRSEDIPAWVQGANIAGWYWHAQLGLQTGGVPVTVPLARLGEAQSVLESHHRNRLGGPAVEVPPEPRPIPEPPQTEEYGPAEEVPPMDTEGALVTDAGFDEAVTAAKLLRSSKVLLFLICTVYPAPYLLYGGIQILREIRRARGRGHRCKELRMARGLTIAAVVISGILTPVVVIFAVGVLVWMVGRLIEKL